MQYDEPVATTYLPTGHTVHEDDEVAEAKRPALHEAHALAPAAEYFPASHAPVQAVVRPVAALNLPEAHAVHEDWPVEAW